MMQLGSLRSGTEDFEKKEREDVLFQNSEKRPFFRSSLITCFRKILTLSSAWGIMIIQRIAIPICKNKEDWLQLATRKRGRVDDLISIL